VINLNPVPQRIGSDVFYGVPLDKVRLYVPASSVEACKKAAGWSEFETIKGL
jgi:hypothetical protein